MSYKPIWHNYEIEHPTYEKDYLVFVVADDDYGNVDYIDVCQWNGEYFEGGGKTGIDDGLDPSYWMELPDPPVRDEQPVLISVENELNDVPLNKEQVEAVYAALAELQNLADLVINMFAPIIGQITALVDNSNMLEAMKTEDN